MHTIAALILGLLLAGPAAALCTGDSFADMMTEEERAAVAREVAATPYPEGLVWRAERGERRLAIVGTMHVWDPRLEPLLETLVRQLDIADLLLVEASPAEQSEMIRALGRDPSRVLITEGPTLPDRLPPETWAALKAAAEARGVPGFMAAKMQPWYLAIALGVPSCAMPDVVAGRGGLDQMLMDAAEDRDLPIRSLEPWTTVLDIFEATTEAEQIDMLRFSAGPEELQTQSFVAMLDGYFAGRTAELWAISRQATYRTPGLTRDEADEILAITRTQLLADRNAAWAEAIEAVEAPRAMVAVGALHLPGEDGLLALLEQAGWSVAPL